MRDRDDKEEIYKNFKFSDFEKSEFERRKTSAFEKWEKNNGSQNKINPYNFISIFILMGCLVGVIISIVLDTNISYGVLYGVLLGFCLGSFMAGRKRK
ncbi:MAG: hypothetical protein HFE59_07170 [Clostridiales bacterium]|nr:hypothetical protein [Clostridiales bacterium]